MAKHRMRGKHRADEPGANIKTVAEIKDALAVSPPTPYLIGLKGSSIDFLLAARTAQRKGAKERAELQAQIKEPDLFFKVRREKKNFALGKLAEWAANKVYIVHDSLQTGARKAFLDGRPENVQTMLSAPEKFLSEFNRRSKTEFSFIADNIIHLMHAHAKPADVPALALAKIADGKNKQRILDYTLYRLTDRYVEIEDKAVALLQAGAKANGLVLANAINKKASPALIYQLVKSGADYDSAYKSMAANPGRYSKSREELASVKSGRHGRPAHAKPELAILPPQF